MFSEEGNGLLEPNYSSLCMPPITFEEIVIVMIRDDYKQLLDEVFVISRIIKVEVRVISRSRRLRLITLTETLIITGYHKNRIY